MKKLTKEQVLRQCKRYGNAHQSQNGSSVLYQLIGYVNCLIENNLISERTYDSISIIELTKCIVKN